jgi:Flp pilus assembly protein TadG
VHARRDRERQKGAAAVEFAIVLPLLVILIFGMIEFSVLFYDKAMITNASREETRAGIVFRHPTRVTEPEIQAVVAQYCQDHLITFGDDSSLVVSAPTDGLGSGDLLTVQVQYAYEFLVIPNFITGLTGTIQLMSETVMRME